MYRCDNCDHEYTEEELEALPHTMNYALGQEVPQCRCGSVQIDLVDPDFDFLYYAEFDDDPH